ncbi:hypothetical protein AT746_15555 [Lacimicrobium alkaliphilum]|uniref:Uncharacterized protein n=1 Tax=Lacimicrobium alkaliphilum TaxID=1526571 RepID=A0A0U3AEP6_9ALTE|nr:hypothetical protein AT746_15555 [Lacimicrobium alkaliphilum]
MMFTTESQRCSLQGAKRIAGQGSRIPRHFIQATILSKIFNSTAYRVIKPADGRASVPEGFTFFNLCVLRASVVN